MVAATDSGMNSESPGDSRHKLELNQLTAV
jgi:hypothetical protein